METIIEREAVSDPLSLLYQCKVLCGVGNIKVYLRAVFVVTTVAVPTSFNESSMGLILPLRLYCLL